MGDLFESLSAPASFLRLLLARAPIETSQALPRSNLTPLLILL